MSHVSFAGSGHSSRGGHSGRSARLLGLVAVLLSAAAPSWAQASFPVTFRFLPDLSSPAISPVVRAFAPGTMPPGTMNDWGPNTNGTIAPTAPSLMAFDAATNEYRYTETLTAGVDYFYKVHYHTTNTPAGSPGYGGMWISDPLNPRTVGNNADSGILVTDPLAFQLAREQDGTSQIRAVSAGLYGSAAITAVAYTLNGTTFTDGMSFYDPATRLFRKTLASPLAPGAQFGITATDALGRTATASVGLVPPTVVDAPVPAGVRDGITVSGSTATLVLRAPGKAYVYAVGDFSNWETRPEYVMKRDNTDPRGTRWWTTVPLTPSPQGTRFQYLVDGVERISDPYAALVLDQGSDPFVPAVTFPNLPAYPTQTQQLVSVIPFPSAPTPAVPGYVRPAPEDLVVYEMLVRDWVSRHDFQTIADSLQYLKTLGITAIELMPVSEFDGNETWGYNPNHYFAVDKYYGPPAALKALIAEAHRLGMAVILDVVYNHQTGQSPFVRLYNQGDFGAPTPDNPWVNPSARHPFNVFNDNNHESALTQYWLDAANRWWLEEYRVDGFRYDLSKGFAQTCAGGVPCTDANFSAYNQGRINILTRMADAIWTVDPQAIVILEHFADASEERVLANHRRGEGRPGMTLWSNMNTAYAEAAMGYLNSSTDFGRAYPPFNQYPLSGQMTYMESHDEQWLQFKVRAYGACANAPGGGATCASNPGPYNTRAVATALERQALAAAFFLTVPGPKMLWQFGELGYGGGPGECLVNGSGTGECPAGTPGRVSNKPIRWDYYSAVPPSANGSGVAVTPTSPAERDQRRALYTSFSNLLGLRNGYDVFRTPSNVQMNVGAGVVDRTIRLEKDGLVVVVVGNFGLTERTSTPPLAAGSTWYDMIGAGTVAGGSTVTLGPGQWRVYANRDLGVPVAGEAPTTPQTRFALDVVFPNPTAARATVRYTLAEAADARLDAYDVLGRRVATLAEGAQAAGPHEATFDAAALPAGIYVLRLTAGAQATTARVTVAR